MNTTLGETPIKDVMQKVYDEYGNDGFVPDLAEKVKRRLRDCFKDCASLCESGGDETFSYTYFAVMAVAVGSVKEQTKDGQ